MNTCRGNGLTAVIGFQRHLSQVKLKVANVSKELVLVDVPLLAVSAYQINVSISPRIERGRGGNLPPRNVHICVYEPDALEFIASLNDRTMLWVANELGVVQPGLHVSTKLFTCSS